MKTLADIAFEEEEARNAPKPVNHYASFKAPIPDWLEAEVSSLDHGALALIASDLGCALFYGKWNQLLKAEDRLTDRAHEWLNSQNVDVFKPLLRWIAMELID
jgi:hypothetical protein